MSGLCLLALGLSVYLGWHYLVGGSVIGCNGGSACDQVLNSRWSSVRGVLPVSGLAAGAYLALLVASFFIGPATEPAVRRLAWQAMLVLTGSAAGSAVWFLSLQKWVVGAFCPYCLTVHITSLVLALLVMWQAPRQLDGDANHSALKESPRDGSRRLISPLPALSLALAGLAVAAIMAACQATFTPPAVYRGGESQTDLPALDPRAVPLVGSPDARHVVILLFDYKCPHCQQLHLMLDEAIRRCGGNLAFVLCPTPLNTHCNPYIPRDVDEFQDSCELAKIGLAVWVARREAFRVFDRWMFAFESGDQWKPRSLEATKAKAVELVGRENFTAAQADPWIGRYLQTSMRIFGQTMQDSPAVPKLVFGSHWVIPQLNDADDLVSVLHDRLAVPGP